MKNRHYDCIVLHITPFLIVWNKFSANEGASLSMFKWVEFMVSMATCLYVSVSSTEQSPAESVCTSAGLVEPLCVTGLWCVILLVLREPYKARHSSLYKLSGEETSLFVYCMSYADLFDTGPVSLTLKLS